MYKKILVVDDERSILQVIVKYLTQADEKYSVMCAPNGKVACKLAEMSDIDIILMDWEMPEMNGIEALKYLKTLEKTKEIPILIVSAMTSSDHVQCALDAGAMDYIRKPIDSFELLARVKSALKISAHIKELIEENARLKKTIDEMKI
ncbi:MAG: response regulator [Bacteroidia bacterium]|nr:response regulator [Bacteroidia bacterium]